MFSTTNVDNYGVKVSLWKKLAYAIGSMSYSMCVTVAGFYFSIFLLEVVIVSKIRNYVIWAIQCLETPKKCSLSEPFFVVSMYIATLLF